MSIYEIDPADKGTINEAWQTLMRNVGVRRSDFQLASAINNVANILGPSGVPLETSAAMTLYVATTGLDTNDGSVNRPLLTIQAAINKVPKTIKHPVTINVGAGTFDGAYIEGFTSTYANSLTIKGALAQAVLPTGPSIGTITSSTEGDWQIPTAGTVTVTGAGWTVDSMKGKIFEITGGGGYHGVSNLNYMVITSNTVDTITFVSQAFSLDGTTTYRILDWSTTIQANLTAPYSGWTSYKCCFAVRESTNVLNINDVQCVAAESSKTIGLIFVSNIQFASNRTRYHNIKVPVLSLYNSGAYAYNNVVVTNSGASTSFLNFRDTAHHAFTYAFFEYKGYLADSFLYSSIQIGASQINITVSGGPTLYGALSITYSIINISGVSPFLRSSVSTLVGSRTCSYTFDSCAVFNTPLLVQMNNKLCMCTMSTISGTGNTTLFDVKNGAEVYIKADCTMDGGILLDGVAKTLAEMRAGTPKYLTNATTGTRVWGD
jgi:hypothetical protein